MAETIPTIAAQLNRANGHVHQGGRKVLSQLMRHAVAAGADIIVDPQATNENREEGVFTTVQQALDAAVANDRIAIMPGTYTENLIFDDWTAAAKGGIVLYGALPDTVILTAATLKAIEFTGTHDTAVLTFANLTVQGVAGTEPIDMSAAAGTTVLRIGYGVEILGDTVVVGAAAQIICNGAHFEVDTAGIAIGFGTALAGRVTHVTGAALDASPL